jgi:hypothetical protein
MPRPETRTLPVVAAVFSLPVRVYYQDTDAGGVVFHATYLDFFCVNSDSMFGVWPMWTGSCSLCANCEWLMRGRLSSMTC